MKYLLIFLTLFGFNSVIYSQEVPGDTLPPLVSPNGLKMNIADGYKSWHLISSHARVDKNEMHIIWGNDKAVQAFKTAGDKEPVFDMGSILVKLGYSLKKNPFFADSIEPAQLQRIEFMIKNERLFSKTGGWGYARFPYDNAKGAFTVYGKEADFDRECYNCHMRVKNSDFIFSRPLELFLKTEPGKVGLAVKDASSGNFPVWVLHPVLNILSFLVLLCGIAIARFMKQNRWWTRSHAAFQAGGAVILLSGVSIMISVIGAGHHFNVPHAYLGLISVSLLLANIAGGIIITLKPAQTKSIRIAHRWVGRAVVLMMLMSAISGVIVMFFKS